MIKIKEYRLKAGLSQKKLAEKLGISKSYMSQIENEKKTLSVSILMHCSIILNSCPNQLLDYHYPCTFKHCNLMKYLFLLAFLSPELISIIMEL